MGDAGSMSVAAQDTLTGAGVQTITGAKTWIDTTLNLRNSAGSATGTVQNPVFTGASNLDLFKDAYKLFIYQDPRDSLFKARNGLSGKIELTSVNSTDCGQLVQDAVDFNSNQPGVIEFADNTTFPLKSENGNVYDLEAAGYPVGFGSVRYSIRLRSGIWIKGAGWRTIIYAADPPTSTSAPGIFFGDGSAGTGLASATEGDICISDIQLLGRCITGDTNYGSMGNVKLFGFNRVMLHRIKSMFASKSSLQTITCDHTSITDCYVEQSRLDATGIGAIMTAYGSKQTIIANNFIKNAGGEAIGIYYGPNNFIISGNTSLVTTDSLLNLEYGRGQIHVESTTAELPTAKFGVISDNTILNNYYGVVLLQCGFINVHDNVVRHTGFTSTGDAKNNIKEGIRLIGESMGNDIHDNLLYDIAGDGIYLESVGNINFFASGNFMGNHIHDNKIINCGRATSNTYDGIHVVQTTRNADGLNIHDNLIYDVGGTALMRDGIRIDIASGKSIINLNINNNNIKGQLGSRVNFPGAGTVNYSNRNAGVFVGNGAATTYNIPHLLSITPTSYVAYPASSDARGTPSLSVTSTNLVVTYPVATPGGTNNISLAWRAEIQ